MSEEDIVLLVFAVLPLLFLALIVWFFRTRKENKGRLRLVAGNLLVLGLLVSLVLLGGELYYRFIYDTTDSFALTKTTRRWLERHYRFNGPFRDNVESYKPGIAAGKRRITLIGDSFTAGHGVPNVDDRFGNLVRAARPAWEVHVMAQNGWETGNELHFLQARLPPNWMLDQVVLIYCLNDICDLIPHWQQSLRRIYQTNQPEHVFKHSYFLNMLYFRLGTAADPDVANYFDFTLEAYKETGAIWRQQESRLRAIAQQVKRRGGRLSVVIFPFLHNLDENYPFEQAHRQLARFWQSLGVPCLDLMELYRSKVDEDLVVNSHDAHPNEYAHRLAAEALVPFLESNLGK